MYVGALCRELASKNNDQFEYGLERTKEIICQRCLDFEYAPVCVFPNHIEFAASMELIKLNAEPLLFFKSFRFFRYWVNKIHEKCQKKTVFGKIPKVFGIHQFHQTPDHKSQLMPIRLFKLNFDGYRKGGSYILF